MIWLRRKFIWKSFSFVLVTVWCTSGFGIYGKCSSESSRANRTRWRNIHRPTDEAVRTSLPWPTNGEGCITVKRKDISECTAWNRAVTDLWQPTDTTPKEEERKVCETGRKVQEDKRQESFSHPKRIPFRDSACSGAFRCRFFPGWGKCEPWQISRRCIGQIVPEHM